MDIRCICPPKAGGQPRHDHDTVTLREKMDFRSSIAIRNALALEANDEGNVDMADLLAILTERFILYGIERWTIVDAKGQAVPVSHDAIRRLILEDIDIATDIGDAADERYREAVMLPLARRGQTSSPGSPTNGSTSPRTSSSTRPRKPSRRSSITTITTAATEVTSSSLDGVSSSSQSSESVA